MAYATSNNLESPFETLAKAYMDAHENVTINLDALPNDSYGDTIRTQLQAGNATDIVQTVPGTGETRSIIPLAEAGFLEPLSDSSAQLVPEGSESLFGWDGDVYAQPLILNYIGLVYNETAAESSGAAEFPIDWAGVQQLCSTMADQGKSAFLLAGSTVPNAGMTAMAISATRVYAENPNWNQDRLEGKVSFADSPGWQDTLQTVMDMHEASCFQTGAEGAGFDVLTNSITSGTGLGFFAPLGSAFELTEAAPDQTFVAHAFPPMSGSDPNYGIATPSYSLAINSKSEHKEAAQDFLDWLAEPEQATLFAELSGGLPISGIDSLDLSSTWYAPVAELLTEGRFTVQPNSQWASPAVYEALGAGVQGLLTGQATVDSVLESMDAAWER